jgi:type IV pilus assembly protein PilW
MAGFNPTGTPDAGGFVADLPEPNDDLGAATDSSTIAFTMDVDEDGSIADDDSEQTAYRVDSNRLEKFSAGSDSWQTVAENIDALDFVYLDSTGADITATVSSNLDDIASVEVTLLARTRREDRDFDNNQTYQNEQAQDIFTANDHFRRRRLTARILCRNMGT